MDLEKFSANVTGFGVLNHFLQLKNVYNTIHDYLIDSEKFYANVTTPNCPVMVCCCWIKKQTNSQHALAHCCGNSCEGKW